MGNAAPVLFFNIIELSRYKNICQHEILHFQLWFKLKHKTSQLQEGEQHRIDFKGEQLTFTLLSMKPWVYFYR